MANKEMTLEQCKKELELEKGQVEILMKMNEERNNELDDRRKKMNDLKELLVSKSCTYEDVDFYNAAIELVGLKEVVKCKIELRLQLWEEDYAFLMNNLKD